jgi:hypothetical protein
MSKCDVTVAKKFTVNTGNYSSIQPSVAISIKNVDIDKVEEVHEKLERLTSGFLLVHIREDSDLMDDLKKMGLRDFFAKAGENIDIAVSSSIEELKEIL